MLPAMSQWKASSRRTKSAHLASWFCTLLNYSSIYSHWQPDCLDPDTGTHIDLSTGSFSVIDLLIGLSSLATMVEWWTPTWVTTSWQSWGVLLQDSCTMLQLDGPLSKRIVCFSPCHWCFLPSQETWTEFFDLLRRRSTGLQAYWSLRHVGLPVGLHMSARE